MPEAAPAPAADAPEPWAPPESDQEVVFDGESIPAWLDPSMRGYDRGPAVQLPAGDLFGEGPYHTMTARVGDTIKFVAATPSRPAHFEVIVGEPIEDQATAKPPQQSACSLEDAIKTGWIAPDALGPDAKAQLLSRSPRLKSLIEDGKGAPEAVPVTDYVKTS